MNADVSGIDPFAGDALLNDLRTRHRPLVFLLSGPSGVGKDSVAERLQRPPEDGGIEDIKVVVTATTRERRPGEMDLIHYEFLERDEFVVRLEQGYFLENASVYGQGNLYGVPRHQITGTLADGLNPLVQDRCSGRRDAEAAHSAEHSDFSQLLESIQALHDRLAQRNSEDYDAATRRLRTAISELERSAGFDYVVVNETGKLEETVKQLRAIIIAERLRNTPCPPPRL